MRTICYIDIICEDGSKHGAQFECKTDILSECQKEAQQKILELSDWFFSPWVDCKITFIKGA